MQSLDARIVADRIALWQCAIRWLQEDIDLLELLTPSAPEPGSELARQASEINARMEATMSLITVLLR